MPKGKARSIRWAMRDLDQIVVHIAHDNPQAARKWISKLKKTAEHAARMPLASVSAKLPDRL
ncbi:MAG: type II toxin-antitoxin system RelE/ParE family toxin [Acidobacteria bacterium]|nr:MAG: type II toxin-antitoxin system RelE/ParE family toxin [Acidobacteriota bacterium]